MADQEKGFGDEDFSDLPTFGEASLFPESEPLVSAGRASLDGVSLGEAVETATVEAPPAPAPEATPAPQTTETRDAAGVVVGYGGDDDRVTPVADVITAHGSSEVSVPPDCMSVSLGVDVDGATLATTACDHVTHTALAAEMQKWMGDVQQTPPMVSAIKKNGVPLYKLARRGQEVAREPRWLHIFEFALLDFAPPLARFRLHCTKGTYVRTLCADIGRALGCGAFLEQLRRTRSGELRLADAVALDALLHLKPDDVLPHIIPLHQFGKQLPEPTHARAS